MARNYYHRSKMPTWLKAILYTIATLIILGAIFCFVVLIYGGCTNQTFIEVLEAWFKPNTTLPADTPVEPTVMAYITPIKLLMCA